MQESKKKSAKGMTDDELCAVLDDQIRAAAGYMTGELSTQRQKALEYYLGEPYGNEVDGRSKVVSTDVQDVIEWMLPMLLDMFVSSEEAVRFEPQGPEDDQAAEQETDYVNHVFYQKNDGFLVFYSWFKDALLQKNGYVKAYWEETSKQTREEYQGLSDAQFLLLMQDEELELKQHTEELKINQLPTGEVEQYKCIDAVFTRTKKKGQARVIPVPPEEIGIIRTHNSIMLDDVAFLYHRRDMTISELIEMGYDPKILATIPSATINPTEESQARNYLDDTQQLQDSPIDKSMRKVTIYECYAWVDYDGDGVAELRKVTKADNGNIILDNEEIDSIPFHAITPNIMTHKHYGLSVADAIMDLQLIKSTIMRQTLDNMYFINNARNVVNENLVNIDDLLVSRPNGIIRTQGNPGEAIMPLMVPPIGQSIFPLIEYIDSVREGRTGVSQATTGLDPDLLNNNKGDASVARVMSAAQQRIELIGRVFAETGVKSLFRHLHELLMKHQDKKAVVKLRNQWVEINPSEWLERDDMTVHVGLGTGDRTQQAMILQAIMNIQQQVVQAGDLDVLVTRKNLYKTAIDFAKFSGLRNPDSYFQDPDSQQAQQALEQKSQQAQLAQQNDPNNQLIAVQREQLQIERQKMAVDYENKYAEMQRKNEELQQKANDAINNLSVKLTELELKYQQNVPGALV